MSTKSQVNQNERCLDFIYDLVSGNPFKFLKEIEYEEHEITYTGEVWGEISGGYIYFIKSKFEKILADNGFNSRAFLSWANGKDLLNTSSDRKRFAKKKRIHGSACWCVVLREQVIDDFEESDENVPTWDEDLEF